MSYVSMPPEADHDVAGDLARLMTPFAERYGVIDAPVAASAPPLLKTHERLSREPQARGISIWRRRMAHLCALQAITTERGL